MGYDWMNREHREKEKETTNSPRHFTVVRSEQRPRSARWGDGSTAALGFCGDAAMRDETKLALGLVGGGMVRLLFMVGEDLENTPNGVVAAAESRRRSPTWVRFQVEDNTDMRDPLVSETKRRERETARATLVWPAGPLRERGSRPHG